MLRPSVDRCRSGFGPTPCGHVRLKPDVRHVATIALVPLLLAACAAQDTIVADEPRTASELRIAPYAFHEECAALREGDKLTYHFEAKAPVAFQIYYTEGSASIATVNRADATEFGGVFNAPAARRYCLRWDAGPQGALLDFRIRLQRADR
jgi:hypothetical protein